MTTGAIVVVLAMLFASLVSMRITGAIEHQKPRPTPRIMAPREPERGQPDRVALTSPLVLVHEAGY